MVFRSLGIKRPKTDASTAGRIPPGQYLTQRWPVLHYGSIPGFDPATWDFSVIGLVETPLRFTWSEFQDLPQVTVLADMHCVTRWSKLDNTWEGVSFREIMDRAGVRPEATHVMFHADGNYTANIPLSVADDDDVLFAMKHDGESLSPEHGFPLRAIVPKRYAWKGAKWIRAVEFMSADRLGFWEKYGYSNSADFWKEERFAE